MKKLRSEGVVIPENKSEAMDIYEKELLPYLRLNPDSWPASEQYVQEMQRKFSFRFV